MRLRTLLPRTAGALCLLGLWALAAPRLGASVDVINKVTVESVLEATAAISAAESESDASGDESKAAVQVRRTASAITLVDPLPIAQVPALSPAGLVVACLLLAAAALLRLRGEAERRRQGVGAVAPGSAPRDSTRRSSGGRSRWRRKS
jgi:hypothetical protein